MAITIQQFFTSYVDAYRRQNVDMINPFFSVPCVIADANSQRVLADAADVNRYIGETLKHFASLGVASERLTIRSLLLLGDEFAVANVAWSMLGSNRNLRTFHSAYNVRRAQGNWAIWAVTAHERIKD
jgi:hypothetical protein